MGTPDRLNIKIIKETQQDWKLPGKGVMGLSPTSSLAKYLLKLTGQDEITVTLKYEMQSPKDKDKPTDAELWVPRSGVILEKILRSKWMLCSTTIKATIWKLTS